MHVGEIVTPGRVVESTPDHQIAEVRDFGNSRQWHERPEPQIRPLPLQILKH